MNREHPSIVVIGATGYTGGLTARQLADDGESFIVAARDPDRLKRLASGLEGATPQVVDVQDRESLRRLIREGDAVINTAGPFSDLGEPVVATCIERGAHYLDTTGEQPFMRDMYERYDDDARAAGVAITPAVAFEYAFGDAALALGAEDMEQPLRSVDVTYAWRAASASRGTRKTVVRMLGTRGWVRRDGRFHRQTPGSSHHTVRLASGAELHTVAFPSGEVVTAPRYLEVDTIRGWLVLGSRAARAVPLIAPALPVLVPLLRPLLVRIVGRGDDPTEAERRDSRFTIRVEMVDAGGRQRALEVRGHDPYGLTAHACIAGARRAMSGEAPSGVLAPSQLVEPGPFLASFAEHGLELFEDRPE